MEYLLGKRGAQKSAAVAAGELQLSLPVMKVDRGGAEMTLEDFLGASTSRFLSESTRYRMNSRYVMHIHNVVATLKT